LKIVETPPGPPVLSTVVAEVYGRPDHTHDDLIVAAKTVRTRIEAEPGVVDVDDSVESDWRKLAFVTDKEKAALHGVTVKDVADSVTMGLAGESVGTVSAPQ
jgi:multidrug efflux pump subunit AcrB